MVKPRTIHLTILLGIAVYVASFRSVYYSLFLEVGKPEAFEGHFPGYCAMRYGIDSLRATTHENEQVMQLDGWAFVNDPVAGSDQIDRRIVLLGSGMRAYALPTDERLREDLAQAYPDVPGVEHSGFRALISSLALAPDRYRLGILDSTSTHGSFYCLTSNYILRTPNTWQLHDLREGNVVVHEGDLPLATETYYGVDLLQLVETETRQVYRLDGWAFFPGNPSAPGEVARLLVLLSELPLPLVVDVEVRDRPDVTLAYRHMQRDLDSSGFRAYVALGDLAPGVYRIGLLEGERGGTQSFGLTDAYLERSADGGLSLVRSAVDLLMAMEPAGGIRAALWKAALVVDPSGNLLFRLMGYPNE